MKALVRDRYGPPEAVELREIEVPTPSEREVLIRVRASSVNPADWYALTGSPWLARLFFGWPRPRDVVLGRDVAGEVVAVGPGVTRFRPGDAVYGEISRAWAEYVCAPEDQLGLMPSTLSFEQAAAIPIAGATALQGLRDKARVQPGQKVLINGASGGVGTFAVQIAKAMGAEVTGVCSPENLERVHALGADHVVDYTRQDFTRGRYDVIFDLVGSAPLSACLSALTPAGVYLSSVGRLGWVLRAHLASLRDRRVKVFTAWAKAEDLQELEDLVEAGALRPVLDRQYPLWEAPEALRRQGLGHARGKTTLTA
jgi:NADPH:quinone reductase-like Zn-dependent oxidoreductase